MQVPNAHFHKDWQKRVKCWFNEPTKILKRIKTRERKALRRAPRPSGGLLRPIVRCCTVRYNHRTRIGKGFSKMELKVYILLCVYTLLSHSIHNEYISNCIYAIWLE